MVGAGPAGSIAAGFLAKKQHKTLLLERKQFPREKVCGDGLSHDSLRFLKSIGLLETVLSAGHEVHSACVFSQSGIQVEVPGPFITIRRILFDSILTQRAVQAGAAFYQGEVQKISGQKDGVHEVTLKGRDRPLQARAIILATGAQVALAKSLRLVKDSFPSALSARCYVRSREKLDKIIGSYDHSVLPGYGWIFPLGGDLYNIGVIAFYTNRQKTGPTLRKRFRDFVRQFPIARKLLESGEMVSALKGAPLRSGLPDDITLGMGNLIATGETIGATLNFTGEGIGKAMETGELAAKVIHDFLVSGSGHIVNIFRQKLDRDFRPKYSGYIQAERWLSIPWFNDFMARRVTRSNYLKNAVIDIIVRDIDPRTVFSLRGVLLSFLR